MLSSRRKDKRQLKSIFSKSSSFLWRSLYPYLATQRKMWKFFGPILLTRNRSSIGTVYTGRYFTQTKTTTEWIAGRLVMKWEKMCGTPLASSVYTKPIPGTLTRPRLGPRPRIQAIETLLCISNSYRFTVQKCHTYMMMKKAVAMTSGTQPP
ncbi:Os04g0613950 [Oryza sativa Japonica Group]|uniref:Os04g0613950 protein n=1 Tax=Oryza sativa subsp. japonica TaxID=39947 RepID=A0A0P0WEQ6_ORYSJ|nr:hypothetical protein EE612_025526 [Oryza sativa]BAS90984.1 Os04g0613950 [Oryza sativa Japonica Group]